MMEVRPPYRDTGRNMSVCTDVKNDLSNLSDGHAYALIGRADEQIVLDDHQRMFFKRVQHELDQ